MKRNAVELAVALLALVAGGAAEEILPRAFFAGAPVLMSAAAYFASRRGPLPGILFAVAAGAFEDALGGLPWATSVSFFVALAALIKSFRLHVACAAPAYAAYQVWLWIWLGSSLAGNVFARALAALPVGAATLGATVLVLAWVDRKAAVGEK